MKRGIVLTLIITAVILCSCAAHAGGLLTMDAAAEAALAANPELAAAGHAHDAQRARPPQAATPPDPEFMVDFWGVPTNTADVSQGMIMYMVEQQIPFPSKLVSGYRAEKRAAEAALSRREATAQEIVRRVKLSYLDLWRLQKEEGIERETLARYRQGRGSAEAAYAALKGPVADPVRASVDQGETEARLALLQQERIAALAALEQAMGAPLDPRIRLAPPPPSPAVAPLDELLARAKQSRPEISEAERMAESERERLSVARAHYAPDFTLRWGFMDNPAGIPNAWYGRVGITVPLWSLSKQRLGVVESKAQLARARSMKEAAEIQAASDVKSAYARLMAARRAVAIYSGTVVPRARMLVASAREAYASDTGDFLSVVDAIRSLNDAQVNLIRARADEGKAYANLERAVGAPIGKE